MMIKYNGTNVHALPDLRYVEKRIKNKKTGKVRIVRTVDINQTPQDVHWLRPGWNQFPARVFEQHREHPAIKSMIEKGTIEFLPADLKNAKGKTVKLAAATTDAEFNLADVNEKSAIEIGKATFDRELLQRWIDEESRPKVRRALEKHFDKTFGTKKDMPDDEDGDEDEGAA